MDDNGRTCKGKPKIIRSNLFVPNRQSANKERETFYISPDWLLREFGEECKTDKYLYPLYYLTKLINYITSSILRR